MRPVRRTISASGPDAPIPLDWRGSDPSFTVGMDLGGATGTYTVEYTLDDVFAPGFSPAAAKWWPAPDAALVGATTPQSKTLSLPCTAVRVNFAAFTAGGAPAVFTVVPANGLSG